MTAKSPALNSLTNTHHWALVAGLFALSLAAFVPEVRTEGEPPLPEPPLFTCERCGSLLGDQFLERLTLLDGRWVACPKSECTRAYRWQTGETVSGHRVLLANVGVEVLPE